MLVDCWVLLDDMGMRLDNQPELLVEPFSTPACIPICSAIGIKTKIIYII